MLIHRGSPRRGGTRADSGVDQAALLLLPATSVRPWLYAVLCSFTQPVVGVSHPVPRASCLGELSWTKRAQYL